MQQLIRMRSMHPQMKIAYECEMAYVDRWITDHPGVTRPTVLDAGCGFQYGLVMHYRGRVDVFGVEMDEHVLQKIATSPGEWSAMPCNCRPPPACST